jgi:hypothetical protein
MPIGFSSASYVSERAKLCIVLAFAMSLVACDRDRVLPIYDEAGTLRRLDYDTDHDGRTDMRAYLANGRTVRIEADGNRDGVIDRWEYYGGDGQLKRLGTSSEADGTEDMWVVQTGQQMRVDISTARNGVADRHEFHENGALARTEQDTNGDGRLDQWQQFANGRLREVLIDTSLSSGQPDRRLVYGPDGAVQHVDSVIPRP